MFYYYNRKKRCDHISLAPELEDLKCLLCLASFSDLRRLKIPDTLCQYLQTFNL